MYIRKQETLGQLPNHLLNPQMLLPFLVAIAVAQTVHIENVTIQGTTNDHGVQFLGMRYGNADRWRSPTPYEPKDIDIDATAFGNRHRNLLIIVVLKYAET